MFPIKKYSVIFTKISYLLKNEKEETNLTAIILDLVDAGWAENIIQV